MTPTDEEQAEHQFREQERAREFIQPILGRAEKVYSQSLNGIWLGNGGATISILGLIGATAKERSELNHLLLYSLSCFVLGLVAMGIGAAISLWREGARVKRLERVTHIEDIEMGDIQMPSESLGLSLRDARTATACLAALLFVVGCIVALWALLNS